MRLCELFNKSADMGDHVIATTPGTKRPIYASKGPAHEAYSGFTAADHVAAANVHASKAKDLHIASARAGGSLTMKRQAQQHSQFATMHRQAAEPSPQRLAASMRSTLTYSEILQKATGLGSRGGRVIGKTKSGKPVYAGHDAIHDNYSEFSTQDHKDAASLHHDEAIRAQKALVSGRSSGNIGQHASDANAIRKERAHHFDTSAEHSVMANARD